MRQLEVDRFRGEFNRARDFVRLVTILSPTCAICQYGQGVVRGLFEEIDAKALKGFALWLPVMQGDNAKSAQLESASFSDDRIQQIWDPERCFGELFAKTLRLKGIAWDVYLLYASGVTWSAEGPPEPTFWMAQLPTETGVDEKLLLNPGEFAHELFGLLGKGAVDVAPNLAFRLHMKALAAVKRERG